MAESSTLARPYAKAAFAFADSSSALSGWSDFLGQASAACGDAKVQQLLAHPAMTNDAIASAFLSLVGDDIDGNIKNFVLALAENKRLALLPFINEQFQTLKAEKEKSIDVAVESAFELEPALQQKLAQALKDTLGCDVQLETSVDESLIGGAVIRAGDTVIDGSIKSKLSKLGETLSH